MQQRVEEALGRMLPPGQFVVVIRVEPVASAVGKPDDKKDAPADQYYLPGVPARRLLTDPSDGMKDLVESLKPDTKAMFQRFISRITVILLLDKDLPNDVVERVRGLTQQMLSLDETRGDTMEIQRTAFNKPFDQSLSMSGIQRLQRELKSYWALIALVLVLFGMMVFILFMFGPLRDFLNKFVQVLPTLKPNDLPRGARQVFDAPVSLYADAVHAARRGRRRRRSLEFLRVAAGGKSEQAGRSVRVHSRRPSGESGRSFVSRDAGEGRRGPRVSAARMDQPRA